MAVSPVNGIVLGAAAVVVSPTIWFVVQGTVPLDEALTRYLLLVPVCWAAINLVAEFFFPAPGSVATRPDDDATRLVPSTARSSYDSPGFDSGHDAGFDSSFGQPDSGAYGSGSYGAPSFDATSFDTGVDSGFTPFDPAGSGQADAASSEGSYEPTASGTQPESGTVGP